MRRLSNLSPFSNLSGVFFSVDLFFRRRKPINITCVVAGNVDFITLKLYCVKLVLTHLFAPRSRAAKKPYGASLKQNGFSIKINIYNRIRQHLSNYAKAQAYWIIPSTSSGNIQQYPLRLRWIIVTWYESLFCRPNLNLPCQNIYNFIFQWQ